MSIAIGMYHGLDVIGMWDENNNVLKNCFRIIDIPQADHVVPILRPIRSAIFIMDNSNQIHKMNLDVSDIKDLKTIKQLKISFNHDLLDSLVRMYESITKDDLLL